jgi:hypothetical protein
MERSEMAIKMPGKKPSPEEFIAGATATPKRATMPVEYFPWRDPKVRDDVRVQLNAKIPERVILQRDWLANRLGMKKQDVLEVALREWVAARFAELGIEED